MNTPELPRRLCRVRYRRGRGDKDLEATITFDPEKTVLDALAEHLRARPGVLKVLDFAEVGEADEAGNAVAGEPTAESVEELDPLVAALGAAIEDSRKKEAAATAARTREKELRQRRDTLIRQLAASMTGDRLERLGRRFQLSPAQVSRIISAQQNDNG